MDQRVAGKRQIARFHDRRARERGRQLSQTVVASVFVLLYQYSK